MMINSNYRPFTTAVRQRYYELRTLKDVVSACGEVRSRAWFSNLLNCREPWAAGINPPPASAWMGLASLLRTSESEVRRMIVIEWFGGDLLDLAGPSAQLDQLDSPVRVALTLILDRLVAPPAHDLGSTAA